MNNFRFWNIFGMKLMSRHPLEKYTPIKPRDNLRINAYSNHQKIINDARIKYDHTSKYLNQITKTILLYVPHFIEELSMNWYSQEYLDLNQCRLCNNKMFKHSKKNKLGLLQCGHLFHYDCIDENIDDGERKCPICGCYSNIYEQYSWRARHNPTRYHGPTSSTPIRGANVIYEYNPFIAQHFNEDYLDLKEKYLQYIGDIINDLYSLIFF
jgi:hypothetical protein